MKAPKTEIILREGRGLATKDPNLQVRLKLRTGILILLFDGNGQSGGVLHVLDGEQSAGERIRKLIETVNAKRPVAKLVGHASAGFVDTIKKVLFGFHIPTIADSVEKQGEVVVLTHPASGICRFKRERLLNANGPGNKRVRVMIVDDAPVIRKLLRQIISKDPELEIVAEAASAAEADLLLKKVWPDVMTLDIHMPVEDGVSFLGRMMAKKFLPVVMVTSVSMQESEKVFEALSLGAIDYVQKPALNELEEVGSLICEKLRMAAKVREQKQVEVKSFRSQLPKFKGRSTVLKSGSATVSQLVAIGASTGGVQALTEMLTRLPEDIPPIVIVQHIPPVFSRAFCERLDQICACRVKEAQDLDPIVSGQVLLAPGGFQMKIARHSGKLVVRVFDGERVNRHKPSVEVLFQSVASEVGSKAIGVMLTGMGDDGATGLLAMKNKGSMTYAQDEATCVVYGMPGASVKIGAVQKVLPLNEITKELVKLSTMKKSA